MLPSLLLIAGFLLLIKGSDWFVDGSSAIAKLFRIPKHIIGMTVVAFGTSSPELSVSLTAAIKQSSGIAIGNVVGSSIINLLLVGGIIAIICPFTINKSILAKNYPYSIVAALALLLLSYDTLLADQSEMFLARGDGMVLLIFFGIFLYFTISETRESRRYIQVEESDDELPEKGKFILKNVFFMLIGLAGILVGGQFIVDSSVTIARAFQIDEGLIGLTVIALGTSLPESVTSIVAARKGEADIALGNIIGSNIYNIFLVLGLSSAITPISVDMFSIYDTMVLIGSSLLFYIPMFARKKVSRTTGIAMVLTYAVYLIYILGRSLI